MVKEPSQFLFNPKECGQSFFSSSCLSFFIRPHHRGIVFLFSYPTHMFTLPFPCTTVTPLPPPVLPSHPALWPAQGLQFWQSCWSTGRTVQFHWQTSACGQSDHTSHHEAAQHLVAKVSTFLATPHPYRLQEKEEEEKGGRGRGGGGGGGREEHGGRGGSWKRMRKKERKKRTGDRNSQCMEHCTLFFSHPTRHAGLTCRRIHGPSVTHNQHSALVVVCQLKKCLLYL